MTQLIPADMDWLRRHESMAAKEGVCLKPTKRPTLWFMTEDREALCGLIEFAPKKWRIKGVFVMPECRGFGIGTEITLRLIEVASEHGAEVIEAIALNPTFYELNGFHRTKEVRPGSWRVSRRLT